MDYVFLFIVVVLFTAHSLLCKLYTDYYPGNKETAPFVFTVVSGLTVVATCFAVSGFAFSASRITVLLGLLNALVLYGYNFFLAKASGLGPYSVLITFSIAGCIVIPAAVGIIGFRDPFTPWRLVAIGGVLIATYLISLRKREGKRVTPPFLLATLALAFCNGSYSAILDVQQRLAGTEEREELVAITYGVAVAASLVTLLLREKKGTLRAFRQTKRSLIYLITCSLAVASAINLLVFLLELMQDATLLFTFENAGVMLLSVLASCVLFRDRLSAVNIVGCALMAASLVAVALA